MAFRRFELSVTIQVMLILALCAIIAYLAAVLGYWASAAIMMVILALQVTSLLRYVAKTNRELSRFLTAVRHQDLSQSFAAPEPSESFIELSSAFEDILRRLRETRTAKEEQASYLNTLVEHVPVAVLAIDDSGRIDLTNGAARRLLGSNAPRHIDEYARLGSDFPDRLRRLQTGERQLIKAARETSELQLNVTATELRVGGRNLKILSLQDIHGELESREIEAWQHLIRVLTHEIMNSVTPIASLAATASELLSDGEIRDAEDAVDTIAKRSAGLMHFVESYRRLTRIPKPVSRSFQVDELLKRITQLMGPELARRGIGFEQRLEPQSIRVHADPDLIEQALINVLRNAMDAVAESPQPRIHITAEMDNAGRTVLGIEDNGHGMEDAVRDNIFVPFFTTKRNGSGVGLSLVRQIVRAHGGNISVRTAAGQGTTIRFIF
jgi:two-component system, NtrC family, nitrogen regulation sensor histidine kinase NtrY